MKTIKLFAEDAYQKECEATVVDILNIPQEFLSDGETGENRIIVLNQTVFYAMSGGQPGDTGSISNERVVDTRYRSEEKLIIYHYLSEPTSLRVGDTVTCKIDWNRRYKHMLQHSLIHMVGLVFTEMYGEHECIGSNMGEKGRIDYKFFDHIDVEAITNRVQKLIQEDHPISTTVDPADQTGVSMIWRMEPLEDMPCGGTHPKSGAELGKFRLKRKGLSSQGQRIYCMLDD
jgi:Ser-tRNA(Ala) deacylase AlaX